MICLVSGGFWALPSYYHVQNMQQKLFNLSERYKSKHKKCLVAYLGMYKMQRERGWARENVHVMSLPAERLQVKCRLSLAVLGHPNLQPHTPLAVLFS